MWYCSRVLLLPMLAIIDFGDAASGNNLLFQIASSGSIGQFWTYSGASGTSAQSAGASERKSTGAHRGGSVWHVRDVLRKWDAGHHKFFHDQYSRRDEVQTLFRTGKQWGATSILGKISEVLLYSTALSSSQICRNSVRILFKSINCHQWLHEAPVIRCAEWDVIRDQHRL